MSDGLACPFRYIRTVGCFILAVCLTSLATPGRAAQVLIEAESFADIGGWMVDAQFMDQMGSPYLLAHGLGKPVAPAETEVAFPEKGDYRVFVRTLDWVARWKVPGTPGRFTLEVNGQELATTFGTQGATWHWQDGGRVSIDRKRVQLRLKDQAGFEGRCISVTHVALGQVRVMRNTGTMGEAVGLAAAVCREKSCAPRALYPKYWNELTARFSTE